MTDLSRRTLLKTAAGTTLLAGASIASAKCTDPMPAKWDETFDVVIIGSGFAGLAAAIEARLAGASVCVLEKMRTIGGNSIINGGIMGVPCSPMQKREGLEDSPELMAQDMIREGAGLNHPDKVLHLCKEALPTWEWTVKELGVEWVQERVAQEGGHSVPRCAITKNGSGSAIVLKEVEKLKSLGVEPRTRVLMERIVRDGDGRVKGVQVREGYRFPKADSGKVKTIRATKGVVLCYGGFSADVKFRMFQDPKLNETLDTTNQPGATSEMWRETSAIGALQVQNDWIQCGPWGCPREKGMGIGWQFNQTAAAEYGLWVNAEGKRFVNELANRKVRADAIMVEQANGKKCFAICNEPNVQPLKKQRPGFLEKMLERKIVEKYDSLEALAKAAGIKAAALKAQVEEFNKVVKAKADPVWSRYINNDQVPLVEGPWYVCELQPKVHHCMGGLVTDDNCEVLDVRSDKPIGHLFAAGEATGGVHGAVRLGSVAILDCLVFGRLAGQKVAAIK